MRESQIFGKRTRQHILILASGDKVRHMTLKPWMAAIGVSLFCALSIGYLAATSYLVLRDDLIGGTMARQARMQHEYEDRIAALRAQVDRVTSRQLLDQQVVEDKVETLLKQQMALSSRHGRLGSLVERAEESGLSEKADDPGTTGEHAENTGGAHAIEQLLGLNTGKSVQQSALAYAPQAGSLAQGSMSAQESMSDRADRLFSKVTLSLKDIEHEQKTRIRSLTEDAAQTASAIESILVRTGVKVVPTPVMPGEAAAADDVTVPPPETGIGGPFVEPETKEAFDSSLVALDSALVRLEQVRSQAKQLPFDNPSPTSPITSGFGNRLDPFLGRLALHAGIDFATPSGTTIRATAPGKVIVADRTGGYGNMVEIDHGNGVTTRYAHLSMILVNVGDLITKDQPIARSGSTGRSTGPHLHYEVRLNGEAVDPMRFLNAGLKLNTYIN